MSLYQPEQSLPFDQRRSRFRHRFTPNRPKYNDLLKRYYWELDRKKRDWEKNYELSTAVGWHKWAFENRGKLMLKEKKAHQATKVAMREEIRKTISACEKKIKKIKREMEHQQVAVDAAKLSRTRYLNRVKQDRRHKKAAMERAHAAEKELSDIKSANMFLAKKMTWDDTEDMKVELLLRCMLTVTPLLEKSIVTYAEMFYLAVGYQKEYFTKADITQRFGNEKTTFWRRDINKLMAADYVKKVDRKDVFYLTPAGTKRLRDIMKHVYTQTYQTYFKIPNQ